MSRFFSFAGCNISFRIKYTNVLTHFPQQNSVQTRLNTILYTVTKSKKCGDKVHKSVKSCILRSSLKVKNSICEKTEVNPETIHTNIRISKFSDCSSNLRNLLNSIAEIKLRQ